MTCIVGIRGENGALIAFDSLSGDDSSIYMRRDRKGAALSDEVAFGYTWSYRYGQIIEHHIDLPPVEGDEFVWAVKVFIPALRAALKEHGWLKKDNEREEAGQLVLAVRNRVFTVESDHSVTEAAEIYAAVGSGTKFARAAIEALIQTESDLSDVELAHVALETASKLNAFVRPPWHQIRTRCPVEAAVLA